MSRTTHHPTADLSFGSLRRRTAVPAALLYVVLFPLVIALPFSLAVADDEEEEQEPDLLELTTVEGAAVPGETQAVTFVGDLAGIETLWLDARADAVAAVEPAFADDQPGDGRATFEITLAEDAAVGVLAVRAVGERGVSNPLLMMIDDLPSTTRQGDNRDRERAQSLDLPVAVDAHMRNNRIHHYRFTAEAGERVAIDVVAERIGSRLDPFVRLLDAEGNLLATAGNEPGLGGDCRIHHVIESDGAYFIELRDMLYDGGRAYRYRLRVGHLPAATTAVPLGVEAGDSAEVHLVPADEDADLPPRTVKAPADADLRRLRVSSRGEGHDGSAYASVLVDDLPHLFPDAPAGAFDDAATIEPPAVVVGRFDEPDRPHYYRFEAAEGDRLAFTIDTDSLGSPANVYPRLLDADGSRIAEPDDPGFPGPTFTHTFGDGGTYRLRLDEMHYAAGPAHVYRLAVTDEAPRFAITADRDTLHVTQGDGGQLAIEADRSGYNGPIMLTAEADDELGVALEDDRIGEDGEEHTLTLTVAADAPPGLHFIELTGHADADDADDVAPLSTRPALAEHWPSLRHPPAELEGRIALYIFPAPEPDEDEEDDDDENGDDEEDEDNNDNDNGNQDAA